MNLVSTHMAECQRWHRLRCQLKEFEDLSVVFLLKDNGLVGECERSNQRAREWSVQFAKDKKKIIQHHHIITHCPDFFLDHTNEKKKKKKKKKGAFTALNAKFSCPKCGSVAAPSLPVENAQAERTGYSATWRSSRQLRPAVLLSLLLFISFRVYHHAN